MAVGLSRIDTVILCGGRGTRLRRFVADRPKPLADFGGVPFLGMLMEYGASFGLRRFILCAGYKGEMIRRAVGDLDRPWDVRCVVEKKARGTGGAVAGARRWIRSDPFLVLNADSFCGADLRRLLMFHRAKRGLVSLVVVPAERRTGRGHVALDAQGRVVSFEEKKRAAGRAFDPSTLSGRSGCRPKGGKKGTADMPAGLHNAGIYAMGRKVFGLMPRPPFSLEYDFFPDLVRRGRSCWGRVEKKPLLDFGTPGGYRAARRLWSGGRLCPGRSKGSL